MAFARRSSWADRLLWLALGYAVLVAIGAVLSFVYDVGASPEGDAASDIVVRGTALVPPLFLTVLLVLGAWLVPRSDWLAAAGVVLVCLIGIAFFLGSTANLPEDLAAARSAGSPRILTLGFGVLTAIVAVALVIHAVGAFVSRRGEGAL